MKNRILFIAFIAGLVLASCGITKNNEFASRKYTKFHKGVACVTSKTDQVKPETVNSNINETTVTSEKTENTVVASTLMTNKVAEKQTKKIVLAVKFSVSAKKSIQEKKKEIKLKSIQTRVLARLADKPNTTSLNADQVLLVILAIFVPPLAVYLARGIGNEFWISVILWILGIIPGIIYALLIVLDVI